MSNELKMQVFLTFNNTYRGGMREQSPRCRRFKTEKKGINTSR